MAILIELVRNTLYLVVLVLQMAMFVRAILSWFPIGENAFTNFLYALTEPVIMPVRVLFERMNWFVGLPIDISFLVTFILLSLISSFL